MRILVRLVGELWLLAGVSGVGLETRQNYATGADFLNYLSAFFPLGKNTDVVLTVNCPQPTLEAFAGTMFERAVAGFRVEDWGLFAG